MKKGNLFWKRVPQIFSILLISVTILSCDKIQEMSHKIQFKGNQMSDEVFIKSTVRIAAYPMQMAFDNGLRVPRNLDESINIAKKYANAREEICNKYGYTYNAWVEKNKDVLSNVSKMWIQANVQCLSGNFVLPGGTNLPADDDVWEKFFIDNEIYLKGPVDCPGRMLRKFSF